MDLRLIKLLQPLTIDRLRKPSFPFAPVLPLRPRVTPPTTPPWIDTGRTRPRYFDGRFLAARDLERDQRYVAARQAEYLRAAGTGVVHGLEVSRLDHATIRIAAGAAITPSGQPVVLRAQTDLSVGDTATTQRLDRELGLLHTPRDLARRGTGVFLLLARPIEYTANPVGFYPASIEERRRPEDGEVVLAVGFSLVPYRDRAVDIEPVRQRAAVARRVFVERAEPGVPVEAVPLALIQLERGFVRWVDPWLVRREIGDAYDGMGDERRGPRAVAEAQVQQYQDHLAEILGRRADPFAAGDELVALPPVGPYPVGALQLADRADRFFPAATPLSLHVVPSDELTPIIDEALALPPIDLAADRSQLAATPVAIVLGLGRRDVEPLPPRLRRFALRSAASSVDLSGDGTGPLTRLLDLLAPSPTHLVAPPIAYFVRLRRAIGDTEAGVLSIERQAIG